MSMFFAGRRRWSKDVVRWELIKRRAMGEDLSYARTPDNLRQIAAKYYGSYRKAVEAVGGRYDSVRQSWNKKRVIDELRKRAREHQELAQSRVDAALQNAAHRLFGGYRSAIEAAGLDYGAIKIRPARWERQQIIARLQELDRSGIKLNYARIKEEAYGMVNAIRREFGSVARALKEAGVRYYGKKKWNRRKIRAALLQLHRQGKSLSLSKVLKGNGPLARSAVVYFGSYRKAIEALDLNYEHVRRTAQWSEEKIVAELRKLVESGVKPNVTEIRRANRLLLNASRAYFGGIKPALSAAGLEYHRHSRWTGVMVVRKLKELAAEGEDLSPLALRRKYGTLVNRAWRLCGSYKNAIEAAGLDYLEVTRRAKWDRRSVLRKLRELARQGADLGHKALLKSHPRILDAAKRVFGSYINARKAAGVGPRPLRRWDDRKIIRELRKLQRAGESLAASRMARAHPALHDAASHHFGGYGRALEAIGLNYEQVRLTRRWTNDSIIAELKALDAKDVDMRSLPLRKLDQGLHMAAYKHFGSYQKALEAAGIEYPPKKPLAGWSRSQILVRLRELHAQGDDLRYAAMQQKHSALFFAARYYFDAYITAVKEAGMDYERIVKEQLHGKKKWRKVLHAEVPTETSAVQVADTGVS